MYFKTHACILGIVLCLSAVTARAELSIKAKNRIDCAVAFKLTAAALESNELPKGRTEKERAEMVAGYRELSKKALAAAVEQEITEEDLRSQTANASASFSKEVEKTHEITPLLAAVKKCREAGIPQDI